MIVQCPKCSARFRLDSKRVSDRGTKVACSNCGNQFTVHAVSEGTPAVDPFVITSVDLKPPPSVSDAERAAASARANNPFDSGQDSLRTAVHKVPEVIRERARMPATIDEASTLVDFQAQAPSPMNLAVTATHNVPQRKPSQISTAIHQQAPHHAVTSVYGIAPRGDATEDVSPASAMHGHDTTAVDDGDLMAIDDSDLMMMDDEATFAPPEPQRGSPFASAQPSFMGQEPSPTSMPREFSRAETAIAHIPSLTPERRPEESAVHRLHAFERAAVPTFADAPNAPMGDGPGLKTFVGRVDAATLAAASQGGDIDLRGGLSADGTFTPPDEPTRSVSIGFGLNTEPADLGDRLVVDSRRATRNFQGADSDFDRRTARSTIPIEVSRSVRIMRGAITVALTLVLAGLAIFALVRSGQLDLAVLRDPALVVRNNASKGAGGVAPVALQSVVYPTARGGSVLVFTGEVLNSGATEARNLDVIAEVRTEDGAVVATEQAPIGVLLDVAELSRLDDAASVRAAFAAKTNGIAVVPPAGRAPYMVVIAPVPKDYRYYRHQVRLAQRAAGETAKVVPAAPAPVIEPEAAPEITEPIDLGGDTDNDTTQRKAKLKAKRAKMKRKARDADSEAEVEAPSE